MPGEPSTALDANRPSDVTGRDEASTLRQLLVAAPPLGRPTDEQRRRRELACDLLRKHEARIYTAPPSQVRALRTLLGWDDETLQSFLDSPGLVNTSTHASMNAFPPMLAFPTFARAAAQRFDGASGRGIHLRTSVTHNNLGDSRWKPHLWLRLTSRRSLKAEHLFSKKQRYRHQILLSRPVPMHEFSELSDHDADALRLARHASNYAYFCLIYRTMIERLAGQHAGGRFVELPADVLELMTSHDVGPDRWRAAVMAGGGRMRRVSEAGELEESEEPTAMLPEAPSTTTFSPNHAGLFQTYRFGVSLALGAERMSSYVSDAHHEVRRLSDELGEDVVIPDFLGTRGLPSDWVTCLSQEVSADLHARPDSRVSLAVLLGLHGPRLSTGLEELLDRPASGFGAVRVPGTAV